MCITHRLAITSLKGQWQQPGPRVIMENRCHIFQHYLRFGQRFRPELSFMPQTDRDRMRCIFSHTEDRASVFFLCSYDLITTGPTCTQAARKLHGDRRSYAGCLVLLRASKTKILCPQIYIANWCYRHEQFAKNNSKLSIGRGEKKKEKVLVLLQGWVNFAKKKSL